MALDLEYDGDVDESQRRPRQRFHRYHAMKLIPTVYEPFEEHEPSEQQRRGTPLMDTDAFGGFSGGTTSSDKGDYRDTGNVWGTSRYKDTLAVQMHSPVVYTSHSRPTEQRRGGGETTDKTERTDKTHRSERRPPRDTTIRQDRITTHCMARSRTKTTESLNYWMEAGDRLFASSKRDGHGQRRGHAGFTGHGLTGLTGHKHPGHSGANTRVLPSVVA